MKDYTDKLNKLTHQPRWKTIAFNTFINLLLAYKHITDFILYLNYNFPRYRFRMRRTPRAHYIGYPRQKPHRFAFNTLACLLILGIFLVPSQTHLIHWSVGWGITFAAFTLYLTYQIIKKRYIHPMRIGDTANKHY